MSLKVFSGTFFPQAYHPPSTAVTSMFPVNLVLEWWDLTELHVRGLGSSWNPLNTFKLAINRGRLREEGAVWKWRHVPLLLSKLLKLRRTDTRLHVSESVHHTHRNTGTSRAVLLHVQTNAPTQRTFLLTLHFRYAC